MKKDKIDEICKYINQKEQDAFYRGDPSLGYDNDWVSTGEEHKDFISQIIQQILELKPNNDEKR